MRLIAQFAPGLGHHQLRERTTAWDALRLTAPELETWMWALGVDGAAAARACRAFGIGPAALDVVLDGRQVRRRLREGTRSPPCWPWPPSAASTCADDDLRTAETTTRAGHSGVPGAPRPAPDRRVDAPGRIARLV
jgi:hypothetical protein